MNAPERLFVRPYSERLGEKRAAVFGGNEPARTPRPSVVGL
jgi:hypothetical protein